MPLADPAGLCRTCLWAGHVAASWLPELFSKLLDPALHAQNRLMAASQAAPDSQPIHTATALALQDSEPPGAVQERTLPAVICACVLVGALVAVVSTGMYGTGGAGGSRPILSTARALASSHQSQLQPLTADPIA